MTDEITQKALDEIIQPTMDEMARRGTPFQGVLFCGLAWIQDGHPQLLLLMAYLIFQFFLFGTLFGNLNALAMEPLGHIAGLGSAVVGSLSTLISVGFGVLIAGAYDGTVMPLTLGLAVLAIGGLACLRWTEAG